MKLGFVFPGQGSQSIGMLAALAEDYPVVEATFAEASDAVGRDLWKLVVEGPIDQLNRTDLTQPAMLAAGVAVWRVWGQREGAAPQVFAGHSLGEYTALVCAESLAYEVAVKLVTERGRLMQQAVPAGAGAMAAILGLDDEQVVATCATAARGEVVEAVNFNSPGQVVIAGDHAAVDRAIQAAKAAGAKRAVHLSVSVPSHCALMRPAAEQLAEYLAETTFAAPRIPVIHNWDVRSHTEPHAIRESLVRQLYSPVRWSQTIRQMAGDGVDVLIESGPGKVLTGLNRRIEKSIKALPVQDPQTLDAALEQTN